MIFGTSPKKKQKQYARENKLPIWNDVTVWKDFRPPYISKAVWAEYIQHVTSMQFMQRSQSGMESRNRHFRGSVTTYTSGSVSFVLHAKLIVRIFYLLIFYKYIQLITFLSCRLWFLDASQAWWSFLLKHMCRVMTAKKVQLFVDSRVQHFVVCWFSTINFIKL